MYSVKRMLYENKEQNKYVSKCCFDDQGYYVSLLFVLSSLFSFNDLIIDQRIKRNIKDKHVYKKGRKNNFQGSSRCTCI